MDGLFVGCCYGRVLKEERWVPAIGIGRSFVRIENSKRTKSSERKKETDTAEWTRARRIA